MTDIVCVDVLDWARDYGGPKFHALLCDPPYELGFMGKDWDQSGVAFQSDTWAALAEHLHPGAFGMAFASARGWHRLAVAIEDAGLRIHPSIFGWSYGSGFPKATRIDTQVDKRGGEMPGFESFKAAVRKRMGETGVTRTELQDALGNYMLSHYLTDGVQPATPNWRDYQIIRDKLQMGNQWDGIFLPEEDREVVSQSDHKSGIGQGTSGHYTVGGTIAENYDITAPATPLAQSWAGHRYGLQALKPALEPIIVFQKPYQGKPVECITETGAGALNIDDGRINPGEQVPGGGSCWGKSDNTHEGWKRPAHEHYTNPQPHTKGRWPANFVLVHHPECRRVGERRACPVCHGAGQSGGIGFPDYDRLTRVCWEEVYGERFTREAWERLQNDSKREPCWRCNGQGTLEVFATTKIRPLEGHRPNPVNVQSDGQIQFNEKPQGYQKMSYTDEDGTEQIAAWDCHESCPARRLGEQSGERAGFGGFKKPYNLGMKGYGVDNAGEIPAQSGPSDTGTAARFFFQAAYNLEHADPVIYCAKASRKERDAGLEEFAKIHPPVGTKRSKPDVGRKGLGAPMRNSHPTVKPIALAQWLATLLLPPEEYAPRRLLIPFAGSGSEAIGAGLAGWDEMTLIEMDADTCEIAEARLAHWLNEPRQLELQGA